MGGDATPSLSDFYNNNRRIKVRDFLYGNTTNFAENHQLGTAKMSIVVIRITHVQLSEPLHSIGDSPSFTTQSNQIRGNQLLSCSQLNDLVSEMAPPLTRLPVYFVLGGHRWTSPVFVYGGQQQRAKLGTQFSGAFAYLTFHQKQHFMPSKTIAINIYPYHRIERLIYFCKVSKSCFWEVVQGRNYEKSLRMIETQAPPLVYQLKSAMEACLGQFAIGFC